MSIPAYLDGLTGTSDTVFFSLNTGSCCHIHAHEEAFVFQLMGTKTLHLYHPHEVRDLYFEPITQDYRRSRVDCSQIHFDQFPHAKRLTHIEVTLEPSDALYLLVR